MIDAALVAEVPEAKAACGLSHAIEKGLPKRALSRTAERMIVERGAARPFMGRVVPEATFKRRVRLTQQEGEPTERVARVVAATEHVWDDRADAPGVVEYTTPKA